MQKLPLRKPYQSLDRAIPLILRPLFRAYILGYASSAGPRLLTLFLVHLSRHRKNIDPKPEGEDYFWSSLVGILKGGLEIQRFPTFCAALVGGSTLLQARESWSWWMMRTMLTVDLDSFTGTLWEVIGKYICGHSAKVCWISIMWNVSRQFWVRGRMGSASNTAH